MSATLANTVIDTPESRYNQLREPTFEDLAHFPGAPKGDRSIWRLYQIMRDPLRFSWEGYHEYGPVSRGINFKGWGVTLVGPEAQELILVNKDDIVPPSKAGTPCCTSCSRADSCSWIIPSIAVIGDPYR